MSSNSPWASQDPNWRPQQFHDARGRDPRQPFGQQAAPEVPPSAYFEPPKRSNKSMWLVIGAVAAVAALILGIQFLGGASPLASPSPTPSRVLPSQGSALPTGNSVPFEGNGDGTFEILSHSWGSEGLTVRIRVEVQRGEYGFGVFAFTNETRESYDPLDQRTFTVQAGTPFETELTFDMPQADSTIMLTTPSGRVALNALPVKG